MAELQKIRRKLLGLRGRIGTALLLDGSARVAGALFAAITLSFLLDRVFKLEVAARVVRGRAVGVRLGQQRTQSHRGAEILNRLGVATELGERHAATVVGVGELGVAIDRVGEVPQGE